MTDAREKSDLILNVSNRCNLRCLFCYEDGCRVDTQPSFETVRAILAEPRDTPPSILMYMGAETLLRRDLDALIRLGSEYGIEHVGLATNGTLLRKRTQVESLLRAGLNHLELSIHSFDPEHAAELSGRRFTRERQQRALGLLHDLCVDYPLTLTINTVVCSLNLGDVAALMETLERDYPRLAPMYHVKYPYSVEEIIDRVPPASLDEIRTSGLVAHLPDSLRPRVVFEHFPLCALAPHFAQSCELIGIGLDHTAHYHLTLPELQSASQGFALGRSCEFAPVCSECSLQVLCPGLAPGYVARVAGPDDCIPQTVTPAEVLGQVARFRRAHALEMSLPLDRPEVAESVCARAKEALQWRQRPLPSPSSSQPPTRWEDQRPYAEVLQEYRRDYGGLTPRVVELIALRAGLQSALVLPVPEGAAGDRRVAQARAFAARAGLRVVDGVARGRRQVILRPSKPSPEPPSPSMIPAFGRPPACCESARMQYKDQALSDRFWDLLAGRTHASWLMNPFLVGTPFQLFRYLPCSLNCRATGHRASALFEALGQHNRRLQEHLRRFRTAPVLYTDLGGAAFLFEGDCLGESIRYDAMYPGGFRRGAVEGNVDRTTRDTAHGSLLTELTEALFAGDGLTLADRYLTIRRGQRVVARFTRPTGLHWRLVDFI